MCAGPRQHGRLAELVLFLRPHPEFDAGDMRACLDHAAQAVKQAVKQAATPPA